MRWATAIRWPDSEPAQACGSVCRHLSRSPLALSLPDTAPSKGILHGVLCWAVTTLVTLYALSSLAGGVIGTATRVAGSGISLAGQGVAAAAPGIASGVKDQLQKNGIDFDFTDARNQLETLLRQTGKAELSPEALKSNANSAVQDGKSTAGQAATTPQNSGNDLSAFFDRLRQKAQPGLDAADKEALINIIVARTGKSRAEAEQIAGNFQQTFDQAMAKYNELKAQAEQKAREAGEVAAKGVSQAAWAGVGIMLLGLLVSAAAGFSDAARLCAPRHPQSSPDSKSTCFRSADSTS